MTDLEMTKWCAEAMGYRLTGGECSAPAVRVEIQVELSGKNHFREFAFDPIHDDAQAMALINRFASKLSKSESGWYVECSMPISDEISDAAGVAADGLNRAIVRCVSFLQAERAADATCGRGIKQE